MESPIGPVSVSLIQADGQYKAIFRTDKGSERLSCPVGDVPTSLVRRLLGMGPSVSAILQTLSPDIPVGHLKACKNPNLPSELLAMEERQVIRSYKFGLLYARPGQHTETELFNNRHDDTSAEFRQFLNFIGEKIELQSWKGYRGGLDTVNNLTGTHSVYTKWQGYEIMLHVSTMLPHNEHETIQLERKRHIGNDILIIIFQDGDTPVQLDSIDSKQNHVVAVVAPHGDGYKLSVARKQGVPYFLPDLPNPCYFSKDTVSRDFFLHKRTHFFCASFSPRVTRCGRACSLTPCDRSSYQRRARVVQGTQLCAQDRPHALGTPQRSRAALQQLSELCCPLPPW